MKCQGKGVFMGQKLEQKNVDRECRMIHCGGFHFLVVTAWEEDQEVVKEIQVLTEEESMEIRQNRSMPSPLQRTVEEQLLEYFEGKRKKFELPLSPDGTVFQKKVWNALLDIPYGEERSYQDIAVAVGSPKGCRAVGMANHNNPIIIVIPCHRVIGKSGKLVGYGGGLDMKERLLSLEKGFMK